MVIPTSDWSNLHNTDLLLVQAQEMKLRRRSLGNIRFIGELYKIRMLTGKIMHECIKKLLIQTDEESLECLCTLVTNIGQVRQHCHCNFLFGRRILYLCPMQV